jgi:hypothetical protein
MYLKIIVTLRTNHYLTQNAILLWETLCDRYQLMRVGWQEMKCYHTTMHFDIKDGKIWIQQNMTDVDLGQELVDLGVPKDCGSGTISQGEGIFGLKRALSIIGARTLIVSLWDVPVQATILLMENSFNSTNKRSPPPSPPTSPALYPQHQPHRTRPASPRPHYPSKNRQQPRNHPPPQCSLSPATPHVLGCMDLPKLLKSDRVTFCPKCSWL